MTLEQLKELIAKKPVNPCVKCGKPTDQTRVGCTTVIEDSDGKGHETTYSLIHICDGGCNAPEVKRPEGYSTCDGCGFDCPPDYLDNVEAVDGAGKPTGAGILRLCKHCFLCCKCGAVVSGGGTLCRNCNEDAKDVS